MRLHVVPLSAVLWDSRDWVTAVDVVEAEIRSDSAAEDESSLTNVGLATVGGATVQPRDRLAERNDVVIEDDALRSLPAAGDDTEVDFQSPPTCAFTSGE